MTLIPHLGSGLDAQPVVARILSQAGVQKVPASQLDLFICRDVFGPALCSELVRLIDAVRRPSTVAGSARDTAFRTSETGDLSHLDPIVQEVELRLAAFTGLDPAYGEPLQGQRYDVGQEFKGHTDYFEENSADYERYCSVAGNRT